MNTGKFLATWSGVTLLALVSACNSGNVDVSLDGANIQIPPTPLPISEPITSYGAITGFGDLTVNGVRYSAAGAAITVDGLPGTVSDLQRGQIVAVSGWINGDGKSGSASSVRSDATVIGPVQAIDIANNRLIAMGQAATVRPDTYFSSGIVPASLDGLAVGDTVRISGFRNAVGLIEATRIDRDSSNRAPLVSGRVADLDLANLLFTIDTLTVDYGTAVLIDLPGGGPANGMSIKATGTLANGLLVAEQLVAAPQPSGPGGQRVQLAGVITRYASGADFDVNDTAVAVNTGTAFIGGTSGALGVNVEVVVDGDFDAGGRIDAKRVTFGRLVGDTTSLAFDFEGYSEIAVPTVFGITVVQGATYSVEVTVDREAADRVAVTQDGPRLSVALRPGDGNIETLEAYITLPVLDRIDLTGVVNATLRDFDQPQMTINVDGVSRLRGDAMKIARLTARVDGVSQLNLGGIRPIGLAQVDIGGVSQATLNMDVGSTLTGSLSTGEGSGASILYYYGTAVTVDVTRDLVSSVVRLGDTRP